MILNQRDCTEQTIMECARQIMAAARTAPKGKGLDVVEICTITGKDIEKLANTMCEISEENGHKFFLRDAANIMQADALILIGTRKQALGLNCRRCGYDLCDNRPCGVPCAINTVDVGIAIGSACSKAADLRIDTRVMHSAGMAAMRLGWPAHDAADVYGIPLSIKSKNPFFDRKPKEEKEK